jgi:hypothetical protein
VQHLELDQLVILALGERTADAAESAHLADCSGCQAEIDDLRHVADLSAETQDLRDLPPPPERVWQGIAAEVARMPGTAEMAENAASRSATAPDADVVPLPTGVRRTTVTNRGSRRRQWLSPLVAAVAAAVLAVVGTVSVIRLTDRPADPAVTARASLTPLAAAPANAAGSARVLSNDELRLQLKDLPLTQGFYEVWLIDPDDLTKMVSVGLLGRNTSDVVLPIAPTIDLNRYSLVDVSAETPDGNSAHSGKSLLRGTLTS